VDSSEALCIGLEEGQTLGNVEEPSVNKQERYCTTEHKQETRKENREEQIRTERVEITECTENTAD
jgi:hypothetical protein